MDEKTRRADYEKSANEYWRWKDAGNNLLIAADILETNYKKSMEDVRKTKSGKLPLAAQIQSQFVYFKAKSLELYLKALYIKQGNTAMEKGKLISSITNHKLLKLCIAIKLPLDNERQLLLNKLTDSIEYWGTYPVPLSHTKWRPNMKGFSGIQPIYSWSENENQNLNILLNKVIKLLKN